MRNVNQLRILLPVLLILWLTLPIPLAAQQAEPTPNNQLKILSWNIYMLPLIADLSPSIEPSKRKERARQIGEIINQSDYHIVVLQEAFYRPARKIITKLTRANFPYRYGPVNYKPGIKTSSGVWILSRIPLEKLGCVRFSECGGADCYARKGAGLYKGRWNNKEFQILGTHILADGKRWQRETQFVHIRRELLDRYLEEGVAQIICGDMNTRMSYEDAYKFMLETLGAEDHKVNTEQPSTIPCEPIQSHRKSEENLICIDYIFHRNNNSGIRIIEKNIVSFIANPQIAVKKFHGTLSDHLAVDITIEL